MAETRLVPPQTTPEGEWSQPAMPLDGPEQQALAILERATIKIASRTPPSQPAEPFSGSADTGVPTASLSEPREPPSETQAIEQYRPALEDVPPDILKLAEEMKPAQDLAQESAQDSAQNLAQDSAHNINPAETPHPTEPVKPAAPFNLVAQLDPAAIVRPVARAASAQPENTQPKNTMTAPPAIRPMFDDHFRIVLTGAQSAILVITIVALVIGAFGMAAHGWATAHDWSCRLGLVNYCPPSVAPKPLALPEIPS